MGRIQSPFPGMDPYLEHRWMFGDLHLSLMVRLSAVLNQLLPEDYYARLRSRDWIEVCPLGQEEYTFWPPRPQKSVAEPIELSTVVPPATVKVPLRQRREISCDVVYHPARRGDEPRPDARTVTSIGVLTPGNKDANDRGSRRRYLRWRKNAVSRKRNVIEIDLLRDGLHTTGVRLEYQRLQIPWYDYHVCVRRRDIFEDYEIHRFASKTACRP